MSRTSNEVVRPMDQKSCSQGQRRHIASNAMTRIQMISCFSVREPGAAVSSLAIHFECVQILVFC